jgi:uncharacterized protein (DUF924 family)
MLEWLQDHEAILGWLAVVSLVTLVGSLIAVPWLVVRLPADYFTPTYRHDALWTDRHPVVRVLLHAGKNVAGAILVVAGVAMLVLPGQGVLTIVVGVLLVDFPGKRELERRLIALPAVLVTINWLRRRKGRAPFVTTVVREAQHRGAPAPAALAASTYHSAAMDALAQEILDFWFGDRKGARAEWFRKDPAFDATIRTRFGAAVEAALDGAFAEWTRAAPGALALVLLLDQFTRNVFRDTPRMFAGDVRALATAQAAVAAHLDRGLSPHERIFLYLPFEHAEDIAMQERAIELFEQLERETGLTGQREWAEKHARVIRRFGRFPHRNATLGRESTPEEIAFLREPGSRF